MSDRLKQHRNRRNDSSWLTMLVDTMNAVSEPEAMRRTCDSRIIDALKAKLERPAAVRHPSDLTPNY